MNSITLGRAWQRGTAAAVLLLALTGCPGPETNAVKLPTSTVVSHELKGNDQAEERPPKPKPAAVLTPAPIPYEIQSIPLKPPLSGNLDVPITRKWDYIVIHHSDAESGSASAIDSWHKQRGWMGIGYHFVIGNGRGSGDGLVEVTFRWEQQLHGAHAGSETYNQHGIGICLIGNLEKDHPTDKQIASLVALVNYLQARCKIPSDHILLHRHVRSTDCPGEYFPFYQFVSLLEH